MAIGIRIKDFRTSNQMTQKELADKLGLSSKMISFYENEQRTPPADILLKLADIFNVSIDYLLGRTDHKSAFSQTMVSNQHPQKKNAAGKHISDWILKSGYKFKEIAEKLEISETLLKDYCSGSVRIPLAVLQSLSELCEVSTDCLLGLQNQSRQRHGGSYPFTFDAEISRRLKDLSGETGSSRLELAEIAGITEEELSNLMDYGFVPHLSSFEKITEHLRVSADYLLNRTDSTFTVSLEEERILKAYRYLNEEYRAIAYGGVMKLKKQQDIELHKQKDSMIAENAAKYETD